MVVFCAPLEDPMSRTSSLLFVLALALCAPLGAQAAGPDWSAVAEVDEVDVLTADEDGGARDTVIWLAVLDGQGYIRTSRSTTWGGNVERQPEIALRIEGQEYALQASFVTDDALREQIVAAFRTKYGWTDGFLNFVRGSNPRIMRLDPR
jgi:hypothetical protein